MRTLRILTAPLLLAPLLLAACGPTQNEGQAQVPTAPSPSVPPSASPAAPETNYDKALRFTRCMNDTLDAMYPGQTDRHVPDPVEGKELQTWVAVPPSVFKPGDPAAYNGGAVAVGDEHGWYQVVPEVFNKCKPLLPAIWPVKEDPEDTRKFAKFYDCLRKRGIDVPKPDSNGIILRNPDPELQNTPEYKAAEAACRHLADDPAVKAGNQ